MNRRFVMVVGAIIFVAAIAWWWRGAGYEGLSPRGYEITVALYSACNGESQHRIDEIEAIVETSLQDQMLSDREADWFEEIFQSARCGSWHEAARQSRDILQAQAVDRRDG